MIRKIAIALLFSASSLPAQADDTPTDMVSFCERAADRVPFYPRRAQQRNITGEATFDCVLAEDNTLSTCQVVDETPSGFGFGRSSLRLACRWTPQQQQAAADTPYASGERHVRQVFRFGQSPASEPEHGSITN